MKPRAAWIRPLSSAIASASALILAWMVWLAYWDGLVHFADVDLEGYALDDQGVEFGV